MLYNVKMTNEYYIISMAVDYAPSVYVLNATPVKFTPFKSEAFIFSDTSYFYEVLLTFNSPGRTIAMIGIQMPDIDHLLSI